MAYAIVRTDKMFGTQNKAGLTHFKFFDAEDKAADIENGNVVEIDGLLEGAREVYKAAAPKATSEKKNILLVADPEVVVEKKYNGLGEFINKADEVVRGYYLHTNDIFSVTDEALDGEAAVGKFVELQADTKLKVADAAGDATIGKVIAIEQAGRIKYNVIQVA